jgi:hypothetical protein
VGVGLTKQARRRHSRRRRRGHLTPLRAFQMDEAVGGIQIGDGAQQPRLAGTRRAHDRAASVPDTAKDTGVSPPTAR